MNVVKRITLQDLKKNRTRTLVTIIGVILSLSMITAVTTFISSLQSYMINLIIEQDGDWHVGIYSAPQSDLSKVKESSDVDSYSVMCNIGYAYLDGGLNEYKPYLFLVSFTEDTFKSFPLKVIEGRLPENESEIVIPSHIYTNGGVKFAVGDRITLDIGHRMTHDGYRLTQSNPYIKLEDLEEEEYLDVFTAKTYTVVGICERPGFERYVSPGYTVITYNDNPSLTDNEFDLFFKVKKPSKVYEVVGDLKLEGDFGYHGELLRFMGVSSIGNLNAVLYSIGSILLVLIMTCSISLIYNSFSISVSERTRQYGLLSGAGATKKQLKASVFYEALYISVIGIPLGILAGILGIGVTLNLLEDTFKSIASANSTVRFTLSVSVASIAVAAVAGIITILLSAYIPARRCARLSAMDAIRQVADIKMKPRNVKTWRITRKVFGIEGDLALKNIKRNKKRYRSTVISLFVSIVLFISASSLSSYMIDSVTTVYQNLNYDLSYRTGLNDKFDEKTQAVYERITRLGSIKKSSVINNMYARLTLPKSKVDDDYYNLIKSHGFLSDGDNLDIFISLYYLDDVTFKEFLKEIGENQALYFDEENPRCLVVDRQQYFDYTQERMIDQNILKQEVVKEIDVTIDNEQGYEPVKLAIGKYVSDTPIGIRHYSDYNSITVMIPQSIKDSVFAEYKDMWDTNLTMYFTSDNPFKAAEEIAEILLEEGLSTSKLSNHAEILANTRNIVTIINVFAYGFIILISLITVANVFNTISTNMELRTREFAMLRSVGMTSKGFRKMVSFESVFYGLKALIYGLPVAVGITYLIYKSMLQGVDVRFYIPATSMCITVIMVFVVVFATMTYSMNKLKKKNILEGLRIEK